MREIIIIAASVSEVRNVSPELSLWSAPSFDSVYV